MAVNVRDAGAFGDGVTDDMGVIHQARDAAGVGGVVQVPDGVYLLGAPLLLNIAQQRWELEPGAVLLCGAVNQSGVLVTGIGTVITGGAIDGNRAIHTNLVAAIILRANRAALEGVEVRGGRYYGVLANAANHMRIVGCYCHDNGGSDIWVGGHPTIETVGTLIEGNTIVGSGSEAGIEVRGDAPALSVLCRHTRIIGNHVERADTTDICIEVFGGAPNTVIGANTARGGWMGISVDKSDGSAVSGNTCAGGKFGIEMAGSRYTTISGNTIDCAGIENSIGVTCSNIGVGDLTISGNTIRRAAKAGIHLNGTIAGADGFAITGNSLMDCGIGVYAQGAADITITGNRFRSGKGITLENSEHITIAGNNMRSLTRGISLSGTNKAVDNVNIVGNNLQGVALPLLLSGLIGATVRVAGNIGLDDGAVLRSALIGPGGGLVGPLPSSGEL